MVHIIKCKPHMLYRVLGCWRERERERERPLSTPHPKPHQESSSLNLFSFISSLTLSPRPHSGEHSSFLYDELLSLCDLNLTAVFVDLAREINPLSRSLPLVVHHQGKILEALLGKGMGKDAREASLRLITALARDLGKRAMN
jgi:hypothetical protein